jgi:hypothetical protein
MHLVTKSAPLAVVLLLSAYMAPDLPERALGATARAGARSGLTVSISGPTYVAYPQTADYTASVSGGSGTYYYTWTILSCNEYPVGQEWCETSNPNAPYGVGANTASRYRATYDTRLYVQVQVSDVYGSAAGGATYFTSGPHTISCGGGDIC